MRKKMKYITLLFVLSNLSFALTPVEIRNQLKDPPIFIDSLKKSCEQTKDTMACNATSCINGSDQACLDFQKSIDSGVAFEKLNDPKVQESLKKTK